MPWKPGAGRDQNGQFWVFAKGQITCSVTPSLALKLIGSRLVAGVMITSLIWLCRIDDLICMVNQMT